MPLTAWSDSMEDHEDSLGAQRFGRDPVLPARQMINFLDSELRVL
jgi:hypothetical protein